MIYGTQVPLYIDSYMAYILGRGGRPWGVSTLPTLHSRNSYLPSIYTQPYTRSVHTHTHTRVHDAHTQARQLVYSQSEFACHVDGGCTRNNSERISPVESYGMLGLSTIFGV